MSKRIVIALGGTKITKGTRYYYKVRAYKTVGEKRIYSPYSNVTYKIAK